MLETVTTRVAPDDIIKDSALPRTEPAKRTQNSFNSLSKRMSEVLKTSQSGTVRALHERDRPAILSHLCDLSEDDKVYRFSQNSSNETLDQYTESINFHRDVVTGLFDGKRLIGLCHIAVYEERGCAVGEMGITVVENARKKGIAARMIEAGFDRAREIGVSTVIMFYLSANRPIANLAKKLKAKTETDGRETTARVEIMRLDSHQKLTRIVTPGGVEIFEAGPKDASRVVMFVHGAGGDAWQWRSKLQPYLANSGIRSYAVSLPNHGGSRKVAVDTIEAYLHDVEDAVAHMGQPDTVVGHSLGGFLVHHLLQQMDAKKAIMVCPVPPHGIEGLELDNANYALGNGMAQRVLTRTMSNNDTLVSPIRAKSVCVIGGLDDAVIPPPLIRRTAQFYNVEPTMVPGGHLIMMGSSWKTVASAILTSDLEVADQMRDKPGPSNRLRSNP